MENARARGRAHKLNVAESQEIQHVEAAKGK
jgi:hypothetical protein